ncbi:DUF2623 domain-containing protein [Edwardsiella piscicida]|nr:DUF2623 domain-containing protein [Edwardsiella piscicida]
MGKNHFGDGVMDGVKCYEPCGAGEMQRRCFDYRRGYVCGFAYSFAKRIDNRYMAACRAGELARLYGLDRDAIAEFFSAARIASCSAITTPVMNESDPDRTLLQ